ncbi:MAG TPA: hypothetical protein VLF91_03480 [Candidatus Saccharimonadales bacterium]|nr:hypothetical protein [Candidatus Saccharimonadales bacterium]
MDKLARSRLIFGILVTAAFVVGALWLLVPPPAGVDHAEFYSPFGTPTTLVDLTFALGGGMLFLLALRNFKKELKPAYRLIAGAEFSLGLLTIVFPIIEYYNLWDNVWWNMSSYLSYLVGSILMYYGARQFLRIIQLKSKLTAPLMVIGATAVVAVIHALLPHAAVWSFSEQKYDAFEIVVIIPVIFYAAAAIGAYNIRRHIGQEYYKAFNWLTAGLTLQFITAVTILVLDTIGYDNWYFNTRLYEVPTILGDFLVLVSAYQFNVVGEVQAVSTTLKRRLFQRGQQQPATSMDIITYIAGMASNLEAVDTILEPMRRVTALLAPGKAPTDKDQMVLRDVYVQLEEYLVTDEPLRTFTRQELRGKVATHLGLDKTSVDTFWPSIV